MSEGADRDRLRLRVLETLAEKPEWAVRLLAVRLIVTSAEQEFTMDVATDLIRVLEAEVLPEMRREGWLEYEPDGMVRLVADETRLARVLDESDEATGT